MLNNTYVILKNNKKIQILSNFFYSKLAKLFILYLKKYCKF